MPKYCKKCGAKMSIKSVNAETWKFKGIYPGQYIIYPAYNKNTGIKNVIEIYYCKTVKKTVLFIKVKCNHTESLDESESEINLRLHNNYVKNNAIAYHNELK